MAEETYQLVIAAGRVVVGIVQVVENHRIDHADRHLGTKLRRQRVFQVINAGGIQPQEVLVHHRQQGGTAGKAVADAGDRITRQLVLKVRCLAKLVFLRFQDMRNAFIQPRKPFQRCIHRAPYQLQRPAYADVEQQVVARAVIVVEGFTGDA